MGEPLLDASDDYLRLSEPALRDVVRDLRCYPDDPVSRETAGCLLATIDALRATVTRLEGERDAALKKAETFETDWMGAKYDFGVATAKLRDKVRDAEAEIAALQRALAERDQAVGNLLARLNGDGGQRQDEVGVTQAAAEAEARVVEMQRALAAERQLGDALARHLIALRSTIDGMELPQTANAVDDALARHAQARAPGAPDAPPRP